MARHSGQFRVSNKSANRNAHGSILFAPPIDETMGMPRSAAYRAKASFAATVSTASTMKSGQDRPAALLHVVEHERLCVVTTRASGLMSAVIAAITSTFTLPTVLRKQAPPVMLLGETVSRSTKISVPRRAAGLAPRRSSTRRRRRRTRQRTSPRASPRPHRR